MLRITFSLAVLSALFVTAGCKGGSSSGNTTPPPPVSTYTLAISSTNLSFPSEALGTPSPAQTATLTNTGTATLTFSYITLEGGTDFSMASSCGASLAPSTTCTLTFIFKPVGSGTRSDQVTLAYSGATSSQNQSINLVGTGVIPANTPGAQLETTDYAFGMTTQVGSTSTSPALGLYNPGSAPLTGLRLSLGGSGASSYGFTTTCGSTLAAGATCTVTISFTPTTTGNLAATLSFTNNAYGSPQTMSITGTGGIPTATLSTTSILFSDTPDGQASGPTVTLSNNGTVALTIAGFTVGGPDTRSFSQTNTCGATLPVGASCYVTISFRPNGSYNYNGTLLIATDATTSPQVITLAGKGIPAPAYQNLVIEPTYGFPGNGLQYIYILATEATRTLDMTMFALSDSTFTADLVAACNYGVKVRVILDQNEEKSVNLAAYNQLNATPNCSAVWANPSYAATHQNSILVDGAELAIMSLTLNSANYTDQRDYAVLENDPADIAVAEATFNADYASTTYTPGTGTDLIWGPTTANTALLSLIQGAKYTLQIETESLSDPTIVSTLETLCSLKVNVQIVVSDTPTDRPNYKALQGAGCYVGVYTPSTTSTPLTIHSNAIIADNNASPHDAYIGSINLSTQSLTQNRELGLYVTDPTLINTLSNTLTNDFLLAPPYTATP